MRCGGGLGALAVSAMLQGADKRDPLAAKKPDHAPTAKSVIWLFMEGGPSHIDIFDPKPELQRLAGQPLPPSFGKVITAMGTASNTLMPSQRTWKQYGQSGMWVSRLVSEHRGACRRPDDVPLLLGGWIESRRLGLPDEYRLDSRGAAFHGRVGDLRLGRRQSRICRRS